MEEEMQEENRCYVACISIHTFEFLCKAFTVVYNNCADFFFLSRDKFLLSKCSFQEVCVVCFFFTL